MNAKQTTTKNAGSRVQKNDQQKNVQNGIARVHAHTSASTTHRHYDEKKKVYVVDIVDKNGKVLDSMRVGKRSDARLIQKGIQNVITQARMEARSKKQNAKETKNAGKHASGKSKKNAKKTSKK